MVDINDMEEQRAIDEIVEKGFAGRKSSGGWKKQLVAVVAVIIIGIPIFGFTFPALAQHIPIIGGIFGLFESETDYQDYSRLQPFSDEVSITGEVAGMSITIEETVFDGQTVYFTYIVESDRDLDEKFFLSMANLGLSVNGVEVHSDNGAGIFPGLLQQVSENTYIAVGSITFSDFQEKIENAVVHFSIGDLDINFPVERVDSQIVTLNETVSHDEFEATLTYAMFSPVGTTVHFFHELAPNSNYCGAFDWDADLGEPKSIALIAFRIRDDLGNAYTQWDWFYSHGGGSGDGWIYLQETLHPEASELIITLYMDISHWQLDDWESSETILGDIVIQIP